MYKRACLLLLINSFTLSLSHSQSTTDNTNKISESANQKFEEKNYSEALDLYIALSKQELANPDYNYRIGICYMHSLHQEKALPYFKKAEQLGFKRNTTPHITTNVHNKYISLDLDFNLARAHHLHHDFETAITYYEKFKTKVDPKHKKVHDKEFAIVNHLIREAKNGMELIKTPLSGIVMHNLGLNINSEYPDYAPVLSMDGNTMVFTSRRPNSTGNVKDPNDDNMYMEDIYISVLISGKWSKAKKISPKINTDHHESASGISPDGQHLFIYKENELHTGDIWESKWEGTDWSEPKKMHHHINTTHFEAGGSISDDGSKFFFVSDRPGGQGERDIYLATKNKKGEWSHPVNLGDKINTPYNEESPFISPDGKTLYFSSKGHNSIGGYDLFKSTYDEESKTWSKAENMGFPINTANDELFFVISHDNKTAYFSTHHEDSYGHYDIYMLDMTSLQKK